MQFNNLGKAEGRCTIMGLEWRKNNEINLAESLARSIHWV